MGRAVVFNKQGNPSVFKIVSIQDRDPGPDEIMIRQQAIGVNFLDVLYRSGGKQITVENKIVGFEAAGVIEKLGSNVQGFTVGKKVAYATAPIGAYREYRCIHKDFVLSVPDDLDVKDVAACLFKGLMAHTLLFRAYSIREGSTILVHSAASGVGNVLTKWSKSIGLTVYGTIGDEAKRKIAKDSGCAAVFNRATEDWVKGVMQLTNDNGLIVLYDGIGADTVDKSIDTLSRFGLLSLYGGSSGEVKNLDLSKMKEKSCFLTLPSIFDYKASKIELVLTAEEIFAKIREGVFKNQIGHQFTLENAAEAHVLLESKKSTKSVILVTNL